MTMPEASDREAPDVSIIVPAFNAAKTLGATLESAIEQSACRIEVICVDDGSTDGTLALAQSYNDKVRVLTGPNQGVSNARNRGIAESCGQWVVFLDADDLLHKDTLATRLAHAERVNCDVVICNWQEISDDQAKPPKKRSANVALIEQDPELAFASTAWATTAALMYRRALVDRIGGFRQDLPVIQDARFAFDAARAGARFGYSDHVGADYRIIEGSLSRRNPVQFHRDILTNILQIEDSWRERKALSEARRDVVAATLNVASRGLFREGDQAYFDAVEALIRVAPRLSSHARIAAPLARIVGLANARRVLSLVGIS